MPDDRVPENKVATTSLPAFVSDPDEIVRPRHGITSLVAQAHFEPWVLFSHDRDYDMDYDIDYDDGDVRWPLEADENIAIPEPPRLVRQGARPWGHIPREEFVALRLAREWEHEVKQQD